MTEAAEQILLMCWAKKMSTQARLAELDMLLHIPNGELRSRAAGSKLKAMGVKAGVPDMLLPIPSKCGKHNALWIEMKAGKGKASETQQEWHRSLESVGGRVVMAWNWKNAAQAICEHLGAEFQEFDMAEMERRVTQ